MVLFGEQTPEGLGRDWHLPGGWLSASRFSGPAGPMEKAQKQSFEEPLDYYHLLLLQKAHSVDISFPVTLQDTLGTKVQGSSASEPHGQD